MEILYYFNIMGIYRKQYRFFFKNGVRNEKREREKKLGIKIWN